MPLRIALPRLALVAVLVAGCTAAVAGSAGATTPECFGKKATMIGTKGKDTIKGTPGTDVIVSKGGSDTIKGFGGKDYICTGGGSDSAHGGAGQDLVNGGKGTDGCISAVEVRGCEADLVAGAPAVEIMYPSFYAEDSKPFEITVTNDGPSPVADAELVVTSTGPAAGWWVPPTASGCTTEAQVVTCQVGRLAVGQSVTLPGQMVAHCYGGGSFDLVASVDSGAFRDHVPINDNALTPVHVLIGGCVPIILP